MSDAQSQENDNTNTGALFPTKDKAVYNGPMNYYGQQCRQELKKVMYGDTPRYLLTVYRNGTVVAQGTFTKTNAKKALEIPENKKEGSQPPLFRGVIKDKADPEKTLHTAAWYAHHDDLGTKYFQTRPDTQFAAAKDEDVQEFLA